MTKEEYLNKIISAVQKLTVINKEFADLVNLYDSNEYKTPATYKSILRMYLSLNKINKDGDKLVQYIKSNKLIERSKEDASSDE